MYRFILYFKPGVEDFKKELSLQLKRKGQGANVKEDIGTFFNINGKHNQVIINVHNRVNKKGDPHYQLDFNTF